MKKFFSSMFNTSPQVKNISKDKEEDDLVDRLENETYLSNEFRFQHQNEKYQYHPLDDGSASGSSWTSHTP